MMNKAEQGEGVHAGRVRRRRIWAVGAGMALIVAGVDAVLIPMKYHAPPGGPLLPPVFAIGGAILCALTILVGTWLYLRVTDELDFRDNLLAFSIGLLFNLSAYTVWMLLYFGGLERRPDASTLFVSTGVVTALAYGWTKLRRLV